ncbi:hypothetical protein QTP86_016368 [Hemibagrus guttatus]|nr:hypothetical protein QTP86_016368 [Hemibagrus guttatus]
MIKESWKVIQEDIAKVGIIVFVSWGLQASHTWNLCEALATKEMEPSLHGVLDVAVKIVNFVKARAINSRLFETHPECKDVFFLFRDVEDLERLRTSKELRAHGLRASRLVMSFIEKSVARLDQLERLDSLAVELGRSHYRYYAPPKYYGYVGTEFICAVRPILKDKWTPELEKAWKTLFQYVTRLMRQGYTEEEEEAKRSNTVGSGRERPDKRNTAL